MKRIRSYKHPKNQKKILLKKRITSKISDTNIAECSQVLQNTSTGQRYYILTI